MTSIYPKDILIIDIFELVPPLLPLIVSTPRARCSPPPRALLSRGPFQHYPGHSSPSIGTKVDAPGRYFPRIVIDSSLALSHALLPPPPPHNLLLFEPASPPQSALSTRNYPLLSVSAPAVIERIYQSVVNCRALLTFLRELRYFGSRVSLTSDGTRMYRDPPEHPQ